MSSSFFTPEHQRDETFLFFQEVIANLEAVGSAKAVKDASSRRKLQSDLEQRILQEHQDFISEMRTLLQASLASLVLFIF
jgi:hypothetical protein